MSSLAEYGISVPFTIDEFRARADRTVAALQNAGVDVLVAFASKTSPGHVRYLTGYETRHGIHDVSYCVLSADAGSEPVLLTNCSWEPVHEISWVSDVITTNAFAEHIPGVMPTSPGRIGVANYESFSAPIYRALARKFPHAEIVDVAHVLYGVRQVKSPTEIEVIRKCAKIADMGAEAFLSAIEYGVTEREVLVAVESALKLNGSEEVSYTTQVGSGPRTYGVHPYATDRRLRSGDMVLLDCGPTYCGYRGDMSRTTVVGPATADARKLLETTADMLDACIDAIRPGVPTREIAQAGVEVARARGLVDCLYSSPNVPPGFMGHGIGTHFHEPPWLDVNDETEIKEHMVFVVEPILRMDGVGGVLIEDTVVVTSSGSDRISTAPVRPWRQDRPQQGA